jgi:hypothetical protein
MREEPIISGAWVKAALVILVGGALGVGAYVLVSGVDIELPDLPDIEEIDRGGSGAQQVHSGGRERHRRGHRLLRPVQPVSGASRCAPR